MGIADPETVDIVTVVLTNLDSRNVARRIRVEREPILVARGRVGDEREEPTSKCRCQSARWRATNTRSRSGRETVMENGPDDVGHEVVAARADGDSVVGVVQAKVESVGAAVVEGDGERIWSDRVGRESLRRIPDGEVPDARPVRAR